MEHNRVPSDFVTEQQTPQTKLFAAIPVLVEMPQVTQSSSPRHESNAGTTANKILQKDDTGPTGEKVCAKKIPESLIAVRKHVSFESPSKRAQLALHPNPRMFDLYVSHPSKASLEADIAGHEERDSFVAFD